MKTATLLALMACASLSQQGVDPALPAYKPVPGISGNVNSVGSDTLNNLMSLWREAFKKHYPGWDMNIDGKGSGAAPSALIEGTAQFGPMSREMKAEEIDKFEKAFGYKPTGVRVAIDALSVFVHKDCPLEQLTLAQVDAIYSKGRKGGYEKDIATWGDLGLTGDWKARPISLYSRDSNSGTNQYFKEHVLAKGDFKDTVKEQQGSAAVVQGVGADKFGIGYSGVGYLTSDVKALKIVGKKDATAYAPNPENVYGGKYPISRFLYVYVNKAPNKAFDPVVREFLKFVLSKDGQEVVVKDKFIPLKPQHVEAMMKVVDAASN